MSLIIRACNSAIGKRTRAAASCPFDWATLSAVWADTAVILDSASSAGFGRGKSAKLTVGPGGGETERRVGSSAGGGEAERRGGERDLDRDRGLASAGRGPELAAAAGSLARPVKESELAARRPWLAAW